jgi:hypothetical protein
MRITIEPTQEQEPDCRCPDCLHPKVSIEVDSDDMTVFDVVELLVKPAIVACGYSEEATKDAFYEVAGPLTEEEED